MDTPLLARTVRPVVLMAGLILPTSCAKAPPKPDRLATHPVSGSLLIDGVPALRAAITFHRTTPWPDGKACGPSAMTDDNGSFRMTTFRVYDGVPVGEYKVTIVAEYAEKGGTEVPVPDLLKGKYSDREKTPLSVTIREGENELEQFDLASQ